MREIGGYRIVRELGAGGMGTVFEAFEVKMNRRVALKVLGRHLSQSEHAGDRFAREAWIGGRLSHPNLVRVFERGEEQDISFYSMEFVDGGSLYDVIKNLKTWGKDETRGLVFGTREYLAWSLEQIVQTARGLDYAHRQGVIHRDIKPMNILLNRDPLGVKVADFGLAVDLGATRMTTAGKLLGTVAYMAPEQIRGRPDLVGPWTDIYSLGVTLFEMLTLELPFVGETQQLYLNAVLTMQARTPRKLNERVGRDLEIVLGKSLEKEPRDRYPTAAALADDLENVLHFRPIDAKPPSVMARLTKWVRRRPLHATLAGLLLIGIPVTGVLGMRTLEHRRLVRALEVDRLRGESSRLLKDHRFGEALVPLGAILAMLPEDIDALRDRSLSLFRLATHEERAAAKQELQNLALGDISKIVSLMPSARWPYRVRGFLLKSFGDADAAAKDEETATRLVSNDPDYYEVQIEGILAYLARDFSRAEGIFGELIRRRPDSPDAREWRAEALEQLGEPARAMTDYEVAVALQPSEVVARLNLARLKTSTGALSESEELYRKALDLAPGDARALEGLSANLLEQGRAKMSSGDRAGAEPLFRNAEAAAREALSRQPDLSWARVNLGASLMERNRLLNEPDPRLVEEAIAQYTKAIELRDTEGRAPGDDVHITAQLNLCDTLVQIRDLGKALDVCRRVVELQPGNAATHYNLAGVLALSNRKSEAFAELERDFELGDRDWQYLLADEWFASLRTDPRFRSLIERMRKSPARD